MQDQNSNQLQMDLFGSDIDNEPVQESDRNSMTSGNPNVVTTVQEWAASSVQASDLAQLETLMTEGSRKVAFNGLEQEQRNALALAVRVVAHAKRSAYERARRGELTTAFDWHRREPSLSLAIELLNASFIDANAIAMA